MSRSRKKKPITGITGSETEKDWKQQEHQRERANVRTALANFDEDGDVLPAPLEFGNPWAGPKDGKRDWSGTNFEKKAKRK
jgi:hypothetical protein